MEELTEIEKRNNQANGQENAFSGNIRKNK